MKICFHPHPPHHSGLEKAVENDKSETQSLNCGILYAFIPRTFPCGAEMQKAACIAECDIPVPGIPVPGNSSFFDGIGTGIEKIWYRKKSWNRSRNFFGTEKILGTGLEKFWYRKKVSESVSFRFWVSSHTVVNVKCPFHYGSCRSKNQWS